MFSPFFMKSSPCLFGFSLFSLFLFIRDNTPETTPRLPGDRDFPDPLILPAGFYHPE
jgi:hypothetical protein